MSLINEALRKARQAAAEHEDQRNAASAPRAYPSRQPRRGVGPAAVALVAVFAGIGGAAVVWWIVAGGETKPRPTEAAVLQVPTTAEVRGLELPSPTIDAVDPPIEEATPSEPAPEPAQITSEPATNPAALPENVTPESIAGGDEVTPVKATSGERVFVLDAELGYASLSLGYIVFRPTRPFAEINGVDVYEGSEVEGFTVEKIEIDRVVLRDDRGPLELRVP